jgi:hypothetical protein
MKLPREVKLRIRPDGSVELETFGFIGKSCAELSDFLEKALAGDDSSSEAVVRDLKAEYYIEDAPITLDVEDREQ